LQGIGDRVAAQPLRKALLDRSPLVRSYAASAIGVLEDHSARTILYQRLLKERSPRARVGLLHGLFRLGDKQQLWALVALLESKSYRVRCAVANTLADLPLTLAEKRDVVRHLNQRLKSETTVAARSSFESALKQLKKAKRETQSRY
jgi:HEAT repeat protein